MKLWVLSGMLLCGALAACSSSDTGTSGSGGSGGSDTGSGGSDTGSGGNGTTSATGTTNATGTGTGTSSTTTGVGPTTTTGVGGGSGICDSGLTTGDALTNECLGTNCCDEYNACTSNGADPDACIACFQAGGGALCDAALACGEANCAGGGSICDSGLTVGDDVTDQCLGDACCDEFNACTSNGADPDACIECFNAGAGALCDAAIACAEESGCFEATGGICDSGLTTGDDAVDACLGEACCDEFSACTSAGADVDACIACFEDGGGALCDAAIACGDESGC